jgi:hypothetical protein
VSTKAFGEGGLEFESVKGYGIGGAAVGFVLGFAQSVFGPISGVLGLLGVVIAANGATVVPRWRQALSLSEGPDTPLFPISNQPETDVGEELFSRAFGGVAGGLTRVAATAGNAVVGLPGLIGVFLAGVLVMVVGSFLLVKLRPARLSHVRARRGVTVGVGSSAAERARPSGGRRWRTEELKNRVACATELDANDVRRARALGGLFDLEFEFRPFRQILTANVLHVEENVVVSILGRDETVTARVVEEVNLAVCHCD